jgi:hypothetical protein
MNYIYYDLHSWSKLYHEELLQGTQKRHLAHHARTHCRPRRSEEQEGRWSSSWLGKLATAAVKSS